MVHGVAAAAAAQIVLVVGPRRCGPFAIQPICYYVTNSTDMINFHALLDNQRFVLGPTLSIVPVGVSAQEPASVSGPGVWRGASGSMPAPYDGERRVRSEGQKGREAFYVYISSLQYSEGKSAQ